MCLVHVNIGVIVCKKTTYVILLATLLITEFIFRRGTDDGGAENTGHENAGHENAGHELTEHAKAKQKISSEAANV